MKLKRLFCALTAAAVLATSVFSLTANADDSLAYSEEYKSSPFYEKLTLALENSKDKTAMEKTLAAALSQEGYLNYSTDGIDIEQAKADGLLWTGKELRMNAHSTGNTEYTRWAQRWVVNGSENDSYIDCDWCAIFVSWCLYQGGYYSREELKKYYYAYCAEPRVEYAADSWILAYNLNQKDVWYAPKAHHKLDSYNWNTYYNIDIDPFDMPYKPGGLVFFTWDGSGEYFDHVSIVVDYDKDTHVLTYTNGNSDGQVITRQIDLDVEEEFRGCEFTKNSNRIMAYADYDEIKPLEPKKIVTANSEIVWDKAADSGFRFQTNSDSKITVIDSNAVEDKLYGDINLDGKISVEDAAMLQRASVGFVRLTDLQNELADVNGDSRVSVLDVTCIQKYIAQFANGKGRTGDKY